MPDDIMKLVDRLRATFFEETVLSLHDARDAANALEALAAECDFVRSSMWSAVAERDRLSEALRRCYHVGCSQVKEIVTKTFSSLPISKCECKIEMGTFRALGAHCPVCGGVIGKNN